MSQSTFPRVIFVALVLLGTRGGAALAAPSSSSSSPEQIERQAAARSLFEEGLTHADAGRWNEAADRFSRAYSLRATPEIAYNLSTALVRVGRLVSASELLHQVIADPTTSNRVRQAAEVRLADASKKVAHVTVHVDAPGPARVWVDGRAIDAAALGMPLAVDPGIHVFELRSGTRTISSRTLSLGEGNREWINLEVPPTAAAESTAPVAGLGGPRAATDVSATSGPARADAGPPLWRRGWFLAAVGAAAVGVGVAVFLTAQRGDPVRGNVATWTVGQ